MPTGGHLESEDKKQGEGREIRHKEERYSAREVPKVVR